MDKKVFMILGVGALGVIAWKLWQNKGSGEQTAVSGFSLPNQSYLMGQPGQQYPWAAPIAPRVDSSNQPWYGGSRSLATSASGNLSSGMDLNFAQNVEYVKGGAEIIGSLSSIWGDLDLGNMWDSGGSEGTVSETDESFDWGSMWA